MDCEQTGKQHGKHDGAGVGGSRVVTAAAVAGLGLVVVQAALLAAARWAWDAVDAPGPATLDQVLALVAAAAAVLLVAWWGLATVAAVCSHLQGDTGAWCRRLTARGAPVLSRRMAAALVGVAVGGSLSSGAALAATTPPPAASSGTASPTSDTAAATFSTGGAPVEQLPTGPGWSPTAPTQNRSAATTPDPAARRPSPSPSPAGGAAAQADGPGWTPTRPLQRAQAPAEVLGLRPGARATADEVVVHRGDTLWSIVARRLGPDASDAEVAAAWPAWHEANRSVIGADPDRLVPGQRLHAPAPAAGLR